MGFKWEPLQTHVLEHSLVAALFEKVLETLGEAALVVEVCHCGQTLRFWSLVPLSVSLCLLHVWPASASWLRRGRTRNRYMWIKYLICMIFCSTQDSVVVHCLIDWLLLLETRFPVPWLVSNSQCCQTLDFWSSCFQLPGPPQLVLCGIGHWTQGPMHAKQALYQWSYLSTPSSSLLKVHFIYGYVYTCVHTCVCSTC